MTINITALLKKEGYKLYTHRSGFQAWSITNLKEYSDEWD